MKDFLIIGAGLSGLSTAYYLKQAGFSVDVLEAQEKVGGRIQTVKEGDWQVDVGANTAMLSSQPLDDLIDALGIRQQVLTANDVSGNRFVVRGGQLWALPRSLWALLKTPLVSPMSKLSLLAEPFRAKSTKEESIAELVARRLGVEWRDWVLDPFVSGIFAGDPAKISAQAAFYRVWLLEKDHGSLFKGMIAKMKARKAARQAGEYVASNHMISFEQGMSTLTRALAHHLEDAIHCQQRVTGLTAVEGGWSASVEVGEAFQAKQVIVTLDAPDAAQLLAQLSPTASQQLKQIQSPPLAVVALGFKRDQVKHALDGFGCLIPRSLGIQTLGAIFSSSIFANRTPADHVLLSCFLGGARMPQVANWSEAQIVQQVLKDMTPLLGITGEPAFAKVNLWPHAIAQYHLGHLEKVSVIRQALAVDCPGVVTRANWHEGISIPDVVANAQRFATQQMIIQGIKS
jgi:oxygen-dependent protoporphyrinogen oxidase